MTAAKFWIGLLFAVLTALSDLGLTGTVGHVVTVALAVVGALSVYLVPNRPAAPPQATGKYAGRLE
ncbi:MAG TPA: hypothetical protein VL652_34750 [Kutzneria sp.]|jgi:hypothetical protein|nr:hypothetical protein [Kutzneria sp.]